MSFSPERFAGVRKGLTAIDVSGGNQSLNNAGMGIVTFGGGVIVFEDGFGTEHTITFPAGVAMDVCVTVVKQTGTTATDIYVGRLA